MEGSSLLLSDSPEAWCLKKDKKKGSGCPGEYSKLTEEEKMTYHSDASQVSRSNTFKVKLKATTSCEQEWPARITPDQKSSARLSPGQNNYRGQPPMLDSAMSPNRLKKQKRDLMSRKRQGEIISLSRQKAATCRYTLADWSMLNQTTIHIAKCTTSVILLDSCSD